MQKSQKHFPSAWSRVENFARSIEDTIFRDCLGEKIRVEQVHKTFWTIFLFLSSFLKAYLLPHTPNSKYLNSFKFFLGLGNAHDKGILFSASDSQKEKKNREMKIHENWPTKLFEMERSAKLHSILLQSTHQRRKIQHTPRK